MYKFEMEVGIWNDVKVTIETSDFNAIKVMQEFIDWQDEFCWMGKYIKQEESLDDDESDDKEVDAK